MFKPRKITEDFRNKLQKTCLVLKDIIQDAAKDAGSLKPIGYKKLSEFIEEQEHVHINYFREFGPIFGVLGRIANQEAQPILSTIVVRKVDKTPGAGYFDMVKTLGLYEDLPDDASQEDNKKHRENFIKEQREKLFKMSGEDFEKIEKVIVKLVEGESYV